MPAFFRRRPPWERGKGSEVRFWRKWFRTKGYRWPDDFRRRLDPETPFNPYLRRFIAEELPVVRVLDVGAGPLTNTGYHWPGRELRITAVDPLADEYRELYRRYGIKPPVETVYGRAEELSSLFGPESFDLVQACNSLDHAADPLRGLREMVACVRRGGWVILNHRADEGRKERYRGFHQWDFSLHRGRFHICGRNGQGWYVDQELSGVEIEVNPELTGWVQVHIHKVAEGNCFSAQVTG